MSMTCPGKGVYSIYGDRFAACFGVSPGQAVFSFLYVRLFKNGLFGSLGFKVF